MKGRIYEHRLFRNVYSVPLEKYEFSRELFFYIARTVQEIEHGAVKP